MQEIKDRVADIAAADAEAKTMDRLGINEPLTTAFVHMAFDAAQGSQNRAELVRLAKAAGYRGSLARFITGLNRLIEIGDVVMHGRVYVRVRRNAVDHTQMPNK